MIEEWQEIENTNSLFFVSNMGRVKSLAHINKHNGGIILKNQKDKDGYQIVSLTLNGKRKACKIHRLVAKAFIPNPENKPEVNHKKGIKTDNRFSELEWATPKENSMHAFKIGLNIRGIANNSHNHTLNGSQVLEIFGSLLKYKELAILYKVSISTISHIKLGTSGWRTVTGGENRRNKSRKITQDE